MLGQATVRNALHDGCADSIRGGLDLLDHIVQQIIEDMPGIHRDLIQFRHNTVDAEGLIAQLACFDHVIAETHIGGRALLLRAHIGQVFGGHVAVLAVRAGHLVPEGRGFLDDDNLGAFLVLAQNLVLRACTGTQTKRISVRADLVDFYVISGRLVLLRDQIDLRGHRCGHRDAKNAAVRELSPLVTLIDGMNKRQFPFAVQSFGNSAGCRADRAQTVIGKVCTISRIYTNQRISSFP